MLADPCESTIKNIYDVINIVDDNKINRKLEADAGNFSIYRIGDAVFVTYTQENKLTQ